MEQMEQRMMFSTTPLAAPTLTATPYNAWQVDLSWKGVSGATNYLVDFMTNGMTTQVAEVDGDTTQYSVTGLKADSTYTLGVVAWSNSAGGTWSNCPTATTFSMPPELTATSASKSSINLAWTCGSGASNFLIDEWENGGWTRLASVSDATTSYPVTWSDTNNTHQFRVGAENTTGTAWSGSLIDANGVLIDRPEVGSDLTYSNANGKLFGPNGPSFLDVQQGAVGDCWLLASLAEVAARDPQAIVSMFTADGTALEYGTTVNLYKVRFFNSAGKAEYVTVDTELPSGGGEFDTPENGVLWVALAEKAYAQANGADFVTTNHVSVDRYSALDGGNPEWALQAITGLPATKFDVIPGNITAEWKAGHFIVLVTGEGTGAPPCSAIVADHCYAVVGCTTPSSNEPGLAAEASQVATTSLPGYTIPGVEPFLVYNPWGATSSGYAPGHDGVFGLFAADAAFLSQNFPWQYVRNASGAPTGASQTRTHLAAEAAMDLVLAGWGT
jgi:hypothetical protein